LAPELFYFQESSATYCSARVSMHFAANMLINFLNVCRETLVLACLVISYLFLFSVCVILLLVIHGLSARWRHMHNESSVASPTGFVPTCWDHAHTPHTGLLRVFESPWIFFSRFSRPGKSL